MPEPQTPDLPENQLAPFHMFRFQVSFARANLPRAKAKPTSDVPLCSGAFAECTGIEATMEPKVIKVGGSNYGPAQRVGPGHLRHGRAQARHDEYPGPLEMVSAGGRRLRTATGSTPGSPCSRPAASPC